MNSKNETSFVGIDWGTTHRRIYALNTDGDCLQNIVDDHGALLCKGRFAQALDAALQQINAAPQFVVMSGMVGSAFGWCEVPYLNSNVTLEELREHLFLVNDVTAKPKRLIVPGYCIRNERGQPDVMRGEETQLLGALTMGHRNGWFALPGTHSKWVELDNGRIRQLRTYMTGELFELLGKHGTLSSATGTAQPVWDSAVFADGVRAAGQGALSHQLFSCRAKVVCGDLLASNSRAYLSGLLIGSELHDVLRHTGSVQKNPTFKLIGSLDITKHYQLAAEQLGITFDVLDADALFLSALAHIQSARLLL